MLKYFLKTKNPPTQCKNLLLLIVKVVCDLCNRLQVTLMSLSYVITNFATRQLMLTIQYSYLVYYAKYYKSLDEKSQIIRQQKQYHTIFMYTSNFSGK